MSTQLLEARRVFEVAPFIRDLGCQLIALDDGFCESRIALETRHQQQDGFVHAGVQATLADHTAGTAAVTLISEGELVLTAEFKVNLLRAAKGRYLLCRSQVLKPGRSLSVVESEVFVERDDGQQVLVSKATVTLAVLQSI